MRCPICEKDAVVPFKPFCSLRCADIDLGKWMTGHYAAPSVSDDDENELATEIEAAHQKTH